MAFREDALSEVKANLPKAVIVPEMNLGSWCCP